MAYQKLTWVNGDRTRPMSAERLAHMETQYDAAMADVPEAMLQEITQDGPVKNELNAVPESLVKQLAAATDSIGMV